MLLAANFTIEADITLLHYFCLILSIYFDKEFYRNLSGLYQIEQRQVYESYCQIVPYSVSNFKAIPVHLLLSGAQPGYHGLKGPR